MTENEIAKIVVDAALKIHRQLGPGLLESVYETVLYNELTTRHLVVARQQMLPIMYEGVQLAESFRADLIVNQMVIIEIKAVEMLLPVHTKQLLTYLRLTDKKLGLLINFNVNLIKHGIKRVVNNL